MSCALIEESNFSKKFDVPFFTMYQLYTDYSGEKWMNVKYDEIEGTKIVGLKSKAEFQAVIDTLLAKTEA